MSTAVCPTAAVEKISLLRVGMVVLRSISTELQQAMYQVSQSAYTSAGGDGAGAKKGKDEGVVEGEYTVE